jgi:hypothetical protein
MVSRNFSEKKMFYYHLFKDGYPQIKAAKSRFKKLYSDKSLGEKEKKCLMKRLQQEASYYANELVADGFLKEQKHVYKGKIRSGNPKTYTDTSFTPSNSESVSSSNSELLPWVCEAPYETKVENTDDYDWRDDSGIDVSEKDIDVHHLCYKYPVLNEPKRKIKWDKTNNKMNGGITQNYLYWKDDDGIQTTIRYDENPHASDMVIIWLPSMILPAGQHNNAEELLDDYAFKATSWLQRVMQCRLGLPELYRRPHYTVPIREQELRSAIEKGYTFKNGEVWMDNSEPKIGPCFESKDFEKTKCYSEMPDRILRVESFLEKFTKEFREMNLEDRLRAQEETMMKVLFSLEQLAKGQEKLIESQHGFQEGIKKILDVRDEKDRKRSVESEDKMYG